MKEKILKIVDEPYYFIKYYFILLLLQCLFFVAPNIQNKLHYVFIAWGSIIIAYHCFYTKKLLKIKVLKYFFLTWGFAFITILLNREAGNLVYSLKTWYLLSLVYLVFFPFLKLTQKAKADSFWNIVKPQIIIQFLFALISILMYVFNVSGYIFRSDTGFYWGVRYIFRNSGKINPLLIGVYNDANYVTVIVFISIIFSLIFLFKNNLKKGEKTFLWINVIVELYIFILANSRAANLALILVVLVWIILFLKNKKLEMKSKLQIQYMIVLLLLIISILFGSNIRKVSFAFLEKPIYRVTIVQPGGAEKIDFEAPEINENKWTFLINKGTLNNKFVGKYDVYFSDEGIKNEINKDNIKKEITEEFNKISENKEDTGTDEIGDIGNGRIGRWMESLKLVTKHRPLTGTSPRGIQYFANKYTTEEEPFRRLVEGQTTVSSVLTFLLYYGWIDFLLFLIFGLAIILAIIKSLLKPEIVPIEKILLVGAALFLLIISVFLSALLEVTTYYSCSTLFILGLLYFNQEQLGE